MESLGKAAETLALVLKDVCGIIIDPVKKITNDRADKYIEKNRVKHKYEIEKMELAERAKLRIFETEIRRQDNLERIGNETVKLLANENTEPTLDMDWFNYFIDSSQDIGDIDLQKIWSKILAKEVINSGSISRVTLDALKKFSKNDCRTFERVAQYILRFQIRGIKYGLIHYDALFESNTSNDIWLSGDLYNLDNLGILNSTLTGFPFPKGETIIHEDIKSLIELKVFNQDLNVTGWYVTKAGIEISEALGASLNKDYVNSFQKSLIKAYSDRIENVQIIIK
ncbi:MAG: DUF2806 domain-containing protein [Saprospiraceae bacterium]|nr:DUF2806 domain-containing protein [Saprospiraceae bacterium]